MLTQNKKAFTLVELIIVITILAILATIGFISYQSYTQDARNSSRITTVKTTQDGLEIYFTKKNVYPTPDNAVTLTGGNTTIYQGILGTTVSNAIRLTGDVKDPGTNKEYAYSITSDGKIYQIATDLENTTSYTPMINTANAASTKALVKGNYSFDPSLPSLITVTGSVNTSSGIFDPNVCFIVDGGANLVTSSTTTCTKKKDMSLKDFDSSLVGYWDMETLSGTMLKDLSGNSNDLLCQDRNLTSFNSVDCKNKIINGGIGKAMQFKFDASNLNIAQIQKLFLNGTGLINYANGYTFEYVSKEDVTSSTQTPFYTYNFWLHRNPTTMLSSIRSYSFSGEVLNPGETSCRPIHSICISNMGFLKNIMNITTSYNYHVIVLGKNFSYFLNGTKIYSFDTEVTSNRINASEFVLGGLVDSTTHLISTGIGFNGIIDDVKIYNRALSDQEIAQQAKIAGF